jgi:succinate dehydrogenase/fumarate reductase flavoprotein subunit
MIGGTLIRTDILVVGAGPGGLLAALSAKRHSPAGTRVTLVDSWTVGRTGHGAFSNAWTLVVFPEDDLEAVAREIVAGNDWLADQPLVHEVLATSHDRFNDLMQAGLEFPKDASGRYLRRPTRGLVHARVLHPVGGGLEFCWRMRRALEEVGVQIVDRIMVTGLMRGGSERITGAVGLHTRTGEFHVLSARATIIATNAITFRSGFVRDITGTGTLLAYRAGAALRNAEQSYLRPGTPKFYFEGITFAIQEGASFTNAAGEQFMHRYEPEWGDRADVQRIARAMAMERQRGMAPLYLDMSRVPAETREYFVQSKVKWMEYFFRKLGPEAKIDLFGETPYYPQNQMTKMGIRTDSACRSDLPGLLVAGLAQAGCANHFAGFHFGMCIGSGWIAGRSAKEDLDGLAAPRIDAAEVEALRRESYRTLDEKASARSDALLRKLQTVMFAYDVSVWKHRERLERALGELGVLREELAGLLAPHTHELVRLTETEAMVLAAEIILGASLFRQESRMNHFREDFDFRDDATWLCWVDATDVGGAPAFVKTPIPTPLYPLPPVGAGVSGAPGSTQAGTVTAV